jgi:hypothetical protein
MNVKPLIITAVFWTACLWSLLSAAYSQTHSPAAPGSQLEEFLIQHRMNRLLLTHREIQAEGGTKDRDEAIEKLHLSYVRELFQPIVDEAWAQQVLAKVKVSIALNPNRKTEDLRLAVSHREIELLQRKYLMGTKVALTEVDRITEEVNLIRRSLKQQSENLERLTELNQTVIGDQGRLNQLRQQLRHGDYVLGWSHFFKSAALGQHHIPALRDAESYFRSFLEIAPHRNLTKFSADQFGRRSRFQTMATVGLAAVMRGIGAGGSVESEKQAEHCFEVAEENAGFSVNAKREIEAIHQWNFAGYLNAGDPNLAARLLDNHPELLRHQTLIATILRRPDAGDELVAKALTGLALNRDLGQLREAVNASPNLLSEAQMDSQRGVLGPWIRGYLALDDYQTTAETASLEQATLELTEVIGRLDQQTPAEVRGHCRFLLGSCLHLKKDYAAAVREFMLAAELAISSETFQDGHQSLAAESAYRALQSVRLLSGDQKINKQNILRWLNDNCPSSPFTKLANFDADLPRRALLPDQAAIAYLSRLRRNAPSDLIRTAASEELAKRYSTAAGIPIKAFKDYVKTIRNDGQISNHAKIQINYHYVSKLISQRKPLDFEKKIEDVLINVKDLIEDSDAQQHNTNAVAKFLFFQSLALSKLRPADHQRAFGYFQQLKRLNDSSRWTSAAAIEIAKIFETAGNQGSFDDQVFRDKMIGVYEFLSQRTQLATSAARPAITLKLARLYLAGGRLSEAETLLPDLGEDPLWLPLQADLANQKNDLRLSATLWQKLEKQCSAGSDAWMDARWNRLLVLHRFDEATATELLIRTRALHPSMPPTHAARMTQLADQWGVR